MMTLYYSKTTGNVYTGGIAPTPQTFDRFGEFAEEFSQIFDIAYMDDNEMVIRNLRMFKVVNGQLVIRDDVANFNLK